MSREDIYEVIGTRTDGSVVILETLFDHDGFRGATGALVVPVSQAEIDHALTSDEKEEWYESLWREQAGMTNGTTDSLATWTAEQSDDEYLDMRYEEYNSIDTDVIAQVTGQAEPVRYTPIGFGRMFPDAINGVEFRALDTKRVAELITRIREIEADES